MNDVSGTNGRVLVETSHALPVVHLTLSAHAGAIEDPAGKEGLYRFVARLMRRTGGGRTAQEIDTQIDSLGASLGADVSHSTASFNGTVISRNLDAFVDLVVDVLSQPSFAVDELERLKRESEAEIIESLDSDRSLARRWFQRKLFEGHGYARPVTGRIESIKTFDAADVRGFYERVTRRDNFVLAFAGDIAPERAEKLAERLLSALPEGGALADRLGDPSGPSGRRLVIVDKPERTQTQILIGGLGTHPRDPDHIALHVGNTVLGGTFTARLMREIRSKRGWSYGAYSSLPYDRHRQAFSMWTFPKASDAAACIGVELDLLKTWLDKGVSKRELAWAKRYLVRSHAFAIDTASKRVGLALDSRIYDLPEGYYEHYLDHVKGVTLEQVNAAIRQRISAENLLVTVVGTESEIGDAVRAAIPGLAAQEVLPFDRD